MVYRLDVPTASATPPAAGAVGTEGFPTAGSPPGVPPATVDPYWHYALCEEIRNVALAGGLTPSKTALNQQLQAMKRLFGGNRTPLAVSQTLNADNAGLVVVNAATGPITVTLPLAASAGGAPLEFIFIRTDTSGNTVTVVDAGSDDDLPGAATSQTVPVGGMLWLEGDGVSVWDIIYASAGFLKSANNLSDIANPGGALSNLGGAKAGISNREALFTANGSWTCPAGITQIYVDAAAGGGGGGYGPGASNGGGGGGGGDAVISAPYTVTPGTAYIVTIGAGGTGGISGTAATAGGNTSLGSLFTLVGGGLGVQSGAGGAAGGVNGSAGLTGRAASINTTQSIGGTGGGSLWGAGGGAAVLIGNGQIASGFGGGGGGSAGTGLGGSGSPGFIRIRY